MQIAIQVIKTYWVDTEGGDTQDPASVKAHIKQVEDMQSTEIEKVGKLQNVTVDYAELVGPSDDQDEYVYTLIRKERFFPPSRFTDLQSFATNNLNEFEDVPGGTVVRVVSCIHGVYAVEHNGLYAKIDSSWLAKKDACEFLESWRLTWT